MAHSVEKIPSLSYYCKVMPTSDGQKAIQRIASPLVEKIKRKLQTLDLDPNNILVYNESTYHQTVSNLIYPYTISLSEFNRAVTYYRDKLARSANIPLITEKEYHRMMNLLKHQASTKGEYFQNHGLKIEKFQLIGYTKETKFLVVSFVKETDFPRELNDGILHCSLMKISDPTPQVLSKIREIIDDYNSEKSKDIQSLPLIIFDHIGVDIDLGRPLFSAIKIENNLEAIDQNAQNNEKNTQFKKTNKK